MMNLNKVKLDSANPQPEDDTKIFAPKGVCSKLIRFQVTEGKLHDVKFTGGCIGNLKGIGKLVEGMPVEEVIEKLSGIQCGKKPTSCPDQLAQALSPYSNK